MKRLLKKILSPWLQYSYRKYNRKKHIVSFAGESWELWPGVFHPGFFWGTGYLHEYLMNQVFPRVGTRNFTSLPGETEERKEHKYTGFQILEMGCGSGVISVLLAKKGAAVTAIDINPDAIANTRANAAAKEITLTILQSDLFAALPLQRFDLIVCNPPYYPKAPVNLKEHAWYSGKDHDFFRRLFQGAGEYLVNSGCIVMVLSEDCDIQKICGIAAENHFTVGDKKLYRNFWETNYVIRFLEHR